jgi:hypothetical protein
MKRFFRERGLSLANVVLVMFLITASQAGISYTVEMGPLRKLGLFESNASRTIEAGLYSLRIVLLLLLATLWALNRKHALFRTIIFANIYFTLGLLVDVISLMGVLGQLRKEAPSLLLDAALMSLSNMLIFSVWYWIIDPPGIEDEPHEAGTWAFLFPQRDGSLPHFGRWSPDYADYLFLGFATNFAFSPTDTLPLTRTAKIAHKWRYLSRRLVRLLLDLASATFYSPAYSW